MIKVSILIGKNNLYESATLSLGIPTGFRIKTICMRSDKREN